VRLSVDNFSTASFFFQLFLELEPQLREVVQCFYDSRYGQCLKLLDEMKDNFLLDIYLAQHVPTLFSMIRCAYSCSCLQILYFG
jgi:COP9 signalosome complex subunit 1